MIEINLRESNKLFVGDEAFISLSEHGSVGIKSEVDSSDKSIISFLTSNFKYNNPLVDGHTGGDKGIRKYFLKAHKIGTCIITTRMIFRGRLKEEEKIKIIVTEK